MPKLSAWNRSHLCGVAHTLLESEVAALAAQAHAFVAADLAALVSDAAMTALRRTVKLRRAAVPSHLAALPPVQQQRTLPPPPPSPQQQAQRQSEEALREPLPAVAADSQAARLDAGLASLSLQDTPEPPGPQSGRHCQAAAAASEPPLQASLPSTTADGLPELASPAATPVVASAISASANPAATLAAADPAQQLAVSAADFAAARARVRPSGLREVVLQLPDTRWADVGGLDHVKQQLQVSAISGMDSG